MWKKIDDVTHIYNGILINYKKKWNCAICRDIGGLKDCHIEWSQKEKNKYIFTHICGIQKNVIDGLICKAEIEIDIENKCMETKARRGLGWIGRLGLTYVGFPSGSMVKNQPEMQELQETQIRSLGQRDSPGGGHGNSFQYSFLENPMDRGAWWPTVHRVTKSGTRLKWLSKNACIDIYMLSILGIK